MWSKIAPRWPQDGARLPTGPPRTTKTLQHGPKMDQDGPKMVQDCPPALQGRPRLCIMATDDLKMATIRPSDGPERLQHNLKHATNDKADIENKQNWRGR